MELFARDEGERYLCGLVDGPCQTRNLDVLVQDPAHGAVAQFFGCLLYTSPSPRDRQKSRMPSSA